MAINVWGEDVLDSKNSNDQNSVLYKGNFSNALNSKQSTDIKNAYWCDSNKKKVDVVDYGKDIYIFGTTNGITPDTTIQISIWEYVNAFSANEIHKFSVKILADQTFFTKLSLKNAWYKNNPNVFWLFFNVHYNIGNQNLHKGFPLAPEDMLKISVVEEIPRIMRVHNWNIAASCQDKWISGNANTDPNKVKPETNLIKMNWCLGFNFPSNVYNEIFEDGFFSTALWKNNKAKDSLINEVKKMIRDGILELPLEVDTSNNFGTFSLNIPEGTNIPLIEKYYYTHHSKKQSYWNFELDEYTGAVGSTTFHIAAKGNVKRLNDEFKITITQLGVYIKDGFEFTEGDQLLGFWNPKTDYFGLDPTKGVAVNNATYRDYRQRNRKGKDFYNYSDVKIVDLTYFFNVPHSVLE